MRTFPPRSDRPRKRDRRLRLRGRYRRSPGLELLENRLVLSWPGTPPATIPVPSTATAVSLNTQNDASGPASIVSDEIDFYTIVAPSTGSYALATKTPTGGMDTVLGLFDHSGRLLASSHDFGEGPDSLLTFSLTAGSRFYVGITNSTGTPGGAYAWSVNGPDDDVYEENDTFATARSLGTLDGAARTYKGLQLRDQDWYRFAIAKGSLSTSDSARIDFLHSRGNLNLELYDRTGRLVAASRGVTDSETISLTGLAAGTYSLRVYGVAGAQNPDYSLTIDPPDDAYEPNDSMATAKDLGRVTGDTSLKGLQLLDDDWFRFTPVADSISTYRVQIDFDNALGNLDLEVFNSNGVMIGASKGITNSEVVALVAPPPGPIYVRAFGFQAAQNSIYWMGVSRDFPDDDKEDNDTPDTSSDLGTPGVPATLDGMALNDADYYRFRTTKKGANTDFVRINFSHAAGDLALALYRRTWDAVASLWTYNLVASEQTATNVEQISLLNVTAGTFVVKVYGVSGAKNPIYSLTIDPP